MDKSYVILIWMGLILIVLIIALLTYKFGKFTGRSIQFEKNVEGSFERVKEDFKEVKEDLNRIERKLDKII